MEYIQIIILVKLVHGFCVLEFNLIRLIVFKKAPATGFVDTRLNSIENFQAGPNPANCMRRLLTKDGPRINVLLTFLKRRTHQAAGKHRSLEFPFS